MQDTILVFYFLFFFIGYTGCVIIQPVHPKGNESEYSLGELMLKLKLQYFGHLRLDSLETS